MNIILAIVLMKVSGAILGFMGAPLIAWSAAVLAWAWFLGASNTLLIVCAVVLAAFNIPLVRQIIFTGPVLRLMKALKMLPVISETEKVALEAGSTWVDGELFSGKPNIEKIMSEPYRKLSGDEKSFIDNQCETLCRMMDDNKAYEDGDLPPEIWKYLRKEKFFGLIVPKEYGGLGFSALAHSEIVAKLGPCSIPLSITVMVPNSLGPAELLVHYGTQKQKDLYLPRLANGSEIPCFGLTESGAGSDAGSMTSQGEVVQGEDGKFYVKLNWKKRYITLGAVATLLGIAAKLKDPKNLLGKGKNPGITCFLVPRTAKGVVLGRRHDPLGVPFYNCPIEGHDVLLPIDESVIGGVEGVGKGWQMLMECLAAGRSISLPAQATAGTKFVARVTGAYAQIRQQFGISIGKFEGIEEVLGRIGTNAYLLEAMRIFTASAVDSGLKPAVISAIAKLNATELSRKSIIDGMDIVGGAGISQGPKNLLARGYIAAPIAITVEGANILTRTMIIFGQGAIRCHPYAYKEVRAVEEGNVAAFDQAFTGHIGHIIRNLFRSILLSVTRGWLAPSRSTSPVAYAYRRLNWASASFAILADIAMAGLGGKLKFREKITGRFADILSWMYLISATLRRFEAEGQQAAHLPFVRSAVDLGFSEIQKAFEGIYKNIDIPVIGTLLRWIALPWSRLNPIGSAPSDKDGSLIAQALSKAGPVRDSITAGLFISQAGDSGLGRLEHALKASQKIGEVLHLISKGVKEGKIKHGKPAEQMEAALQAGVISPADRAAYEDAKKICLEAVEVDSYELSKYKKGIATAFDPNSYPDSQKLEQAKIHAA